MFLVLVLIIQTGSRHLNLSISVDGSQNPVDPVSQQTLNLSASFFSHILSHYLLLRRNFGPTIDWEVRPGSVHGTISGRQQARRSEFGRMAYTQAFLDGLRPTGPQIV